IGCHGFRRTRKLCRAQQSSITRSRMPCFHRRIRSFTMRQRLTLLLTCSIRSRRWCSVWFAMCCASVSCCAALNVVTGQLTTRLLEQPARSKAKTGLSKQQRLQGAFAAHLRDIAWAYPASQYPEVVITIDHAPWHRGALMEQVLVAHPHL